MNENTENINVQAQDYTVLPEQLPTDKATASSKTDLAIGIAGAAVIMLAIPTVVRGGMWVFKKVKGLFKEKTVEPEEATEE